MAPPFRVRLFEPDEFLHRKLQRLVRVVCGEIADRQILVREEIQVQPMVQAGCFRSVLETHRAIPIDHGDVAHGHIAASKRYDAPGVSVVHGVVVLDLHVRDHSALAVEIVSRCLRAREFDSSVPIEMPSSPT